ncbi:membrane protein DedA with SNARE-associated domain [Sphingomonas sp. BE270]|jgi:membrane protein DedA with SNARE-associated domain|uniref:DedA family protein n=1 Tax=unclassified Sphingomonas TaxID=196159 RepID=UPI00053EDDDC|nr:MULTISPECIES: DedA family protein [unclassified Sphingomonas]MDR6846848.1 membrane protein DedA with SNARE-associated domain [Sphingomonas sp. BE137]MDR7256526.1 membrane protein DedA with SNARE-associated domain [Sphingomonas sp. BE270]
MIEKILGILATFTIGVISSGGYLGIALLMAIESACIPLPSEIIMPFAGYLVSTGHFNLYLAATAGAIGCNLGSIVGYEIGKRGGRPVAERWGRYVLVGPGELDAADRFFARFGNIAVLIGRLLPVIRSFIAFPAGVARMPLIPFHIYTFIGSWPWCFGLAYLGMVLGDKWNSDPRVKAAFHSADVVIAVVLVAAIGFYVWHRVRGLKRH